MVRADLGAGANFFGLSCQTRRVSLGVTHDGICNRMVILPSGVFHILALDLVLGWSTTLGGNVGGGTFD